MTPSKQAKELGLKSLAQVSRISKVSTQNLYNWHKSKPELFKVVLAGCMAVNEPNKSKLKDGG